MDRSLRSADARTVALADGIAVFWVVLWLVVAAVTAAGVWRLSGLSDTAEVSARAVDRAGAALQRLGELPVVGDGPDGLGDEVRAAAGDIERSARQTRGDVRRLAIVLGLSVFVIPVTPVLGLYLPLRLERRREVSALRRALGGGGPDPALQAWLAGRALHTLTYDQLLKVTRDPAGELAAGRTAALAELELARLGLVASPPPAPHRR